MKDKAPITALPLVKAPELIKVKTINPKIAEQLGWLDGEAGTKGRDDLDGITVVGRFSPYDTLLVMDEDRTLWRLRSIAYIMWGRSKGKGNDEIYAELKAYPQIFVA